MKIYNMNLTSKKMKYITSSNNPSTREVSGYTIISSDMICRRTAAQTYSNIPLIQKYQTCYQYLQIQKQSRNLKINMVYDEALGKQL